MPSVHDPRGDYADALFHASALLIGAVQDPVDPANQQQEIQDAFDQCLIIEQPAGVDPALALATILAAQAPLDSTAEQRLSWLVEHLEQRPRRRAVDETLAQLDARLTEVLDRLEPQVPDNLPSPEDLDVHTLQCVAGQRPLADLPHDRQLIAVELLRRKGYTHLQTAQRVKAGKTTIERLRAELRRARAHTEPALHLHVTPRADEATG